MLQAEEQNQHSAASRETAPQSESEQSKASKRGGKRTGAGRKPNLTKRVLNGFSRAALTEAARTVDCGAVLVGLLKSKKERTRMEALVFLRDTIIGRPAQDVRHSGGVLHAHMAWGSLASLSDEEMQTLDAITKKLVAPANASPDAHQNQIESKPALEGEVMRSNGEEGEEARETQAGAKACL